MNLKFSLMIFFVSVLILTNRAFSQAAKPTDEDLSHWGGYLDFGLQNSIVKNDVAEQQGFPSSFLGFTMNLGAFKDYYLIGVKISGDIPDDKKRFSNSTTQGTMSSHVVLAQFSVHGGLISPKINVPIANDLFIVGAINAGYMWAFAEERSISGCSDCDVEELDVSGGPYLEPTAYLVYSFIGIGVGYSHYFNSDYKSKLELKLSLFIYQ